MVKIVVRCEMLFSKKSFHKKKKKNHFSAVTVQIQMIWSVNWIFMWQLHRLSEVSRFSLQKHTMSSHMMMNGLCDEQGFFILVQTTPPQKNNNIFLHQNWANVAVGLLGETCAAPHYWIYWVESKRRPFTCLPLLKRCSTSRMWSSYCTALNTLRYILLNATIIHNSTFCFYF